MNTVLVTGGRSAVAVELARHFSAAGYRVIAAESQVNLLAASNFVDRAYRVPAARWYPREFGTAIQEIALEHGAELVLPSCEEVFWLAEVAARDGFSTLAELLFAAPIGTLRTLHHKAEFISLLQSLGEKTPRTKLLESQQQFAALDRQKLGSGGLRSPALVLKPAFSRFGTSAVVIPEGEPLDAAPRITHLQPWLAQEFLAGAEICVTAAFRSGQLRAVSVYNPRWRAGGAQYGAGTLFEPVDLDEPTHTEVTRLVTKLGSALHFTGFLSLDLIDTPEGPVAIECNPRPTSGIHLFSENFASALLSDDKPLIAQGPARRLSLAALPQALCHPLQWQRSASVLRGAVPLTQQLRVAGNLLGSAWTHHSSPLQASTADLQYDGLASVPATKDDHCNYPAEPESSDGWAASALATLREPSLLGGQGIANIDVEMRGLRSAGRLLPLSLPSVAQAQAYVVSPYAHYISFSKVELDELHSPLLEAALRPAIDLLGTLLRWGRVDQAALVNNALISTNLHPQFSCGELAELTGVVRQAHPSLAVAWRSVHGRDSAFPEQLRSLGYRLIPARSVLFIPTENRTFEKRRDYRRDQALFAASGYHVRELTEPDPAQCQRLAELYRMLYIDKYSEHNPQYEPAFIAASAANGMLRFLALERDGQLDAVIGYYLAEGYLTAPFVGYDLGKEQHLGLYRMLNLLIIETAWEHGVTVHASSGVPDFKKSRGAESELEYTAVYTRHLPFRQRLAWAALDVIINSIAQPLIKRFGL
ncbi:hypothetical protein FHU41_000750 [Psychromicrobium silvestre]|uniref:ATP-grasp domain-containing protein n=1 Tax=Psychromicrobium silvestre TaxID=1645614 RepID=A0A7Y9LS08_9MICC|nr:GNAT family N-acetyltransferase [Psychromicrobium silvestre]NYE94529.1 hypothetical protein [Psychromicrobium silvestre]